MVRLRHVGILAGLFMGSTAIGATPASAFTILGVTLWGDPPEDDQIEVIDPLPYTVDFRVVGEESLQGPLQNASALWSNREEPASGNSGLISRAKGDYRRILAALYNAGYYGGAISIVVAGREAADLTLAVEFPQTVPVTITIDPGPAFTFGPLSFVNPPPPVEERRQRGPTFESIGFQPGQPARATVVGRASDLAVTQWRNKGHAKARETGREVVADHPAERLDVTIALDPGREARYGPTSVAGNTRTKADFIAYMTGLREGKRFDAAEVDRSEARLGRLGIFRSIRIEEAPEILPDGSLPITTRVEDRRPRTLGFGGTLSTIDGIGLEAYWLNRNLFGRGERLRFDASIAGIGASLDPNDLDYSVGVAFTKPGVLSPDTSFVTGALAEQVDYDTYRERSLSAYVGLSQQFGNRLTGDISAEISKSRFEDAFGTREFLTFGLIGNGTYDDRNDPLDASRGIYVAAMLQPFYEFEYGNPAVRATLEGRLYHSLVGFDKLVLAGRAKIGTYYGPSIAESPPDLLYFAGGGGSVRGYAYRSIGVELDVDGEPATVGGRGLFEASVEARYRINERFGAVGFLDSGFVTEDPKLSGNSDLRFGTGLGVRYYTGLGPLRFDLATPIDRRPGDAYVALYIGIGQAF